MVSMLSPSAIAVVMNTCEDLFKSGQTQSRMYNIYPDGVTPVFVFCTMDNVPPAVIVMTPDFSAPGVDIPGGSDTHMEDITYRFLTLDSVRLLVKYSTAASTTMGGQFLDCSGKDSSVLGAATVYGGDGSQVTDWRRLGSPCSGPCELMLMWALLFAQSPFIRLCEIMLKGSTLYVRMC